MEKSIRYQYQLEYSGHSWFILFAENEQNALELARLEIDNFDKVFSGRIATYPIAVSGYPAWSHKQWMDEYDKLVKIKIEHNLSVVKDDKYWTSLNKELNKTFKSKTK
jgi:hypothetical protein